MNLDETKLSTEFSLALQIPYSERVNSMDLNVGYNENFNNWELIIIYTGNLEAISNEIGFTYTELLNGYAIIEIRQERINNLTRHPDIIFIEKPKKIYVEKLNHVSNGFEDENMENRRISNIYSVKNDFIYNNVRYGYIQGFVQSCMEFSRRQEVNLLGKGVLVSVIDSGIDITHPEFIDINGNTRILNLWDQSLKYNDNSGVYTRQDINDILRDTANDNINVVNTRDSSGHGTAVGGIIATCVPEADLLIVKLNPDAEDAYPRTTSLMLAIDYAVRYATLYNLPHVINLSFGNNYGSHDGNSVLEHYISSLSGKSKLSIAVGTGNDGNTGRHTRIFVDDNRISDVEVLVPEYTTGINIQVWQSYLDNIDISLITPEGTVLGPFSGYQEVITYRLYDMNIQIINGYPTPINRNRETYIALIPDGSYIREGIWTIRLRGRNISNGIVDIWLPVAASTSTDVHFLRPVADVTLTIPSSARGVISVGAYNQNTLTYAPFSGRGYNADGIIKPDIVAPGVNIDVPVSGGGYTYVSGTSFATPFVASACAMLMQWGIVNENDLYLYGEKIRAYLIKGAKRLPTYNDLPNEMLGYGALCVRDSFP